MLSETHSDNPCQPTLQRWTRPEVTPDPTGHRETRKAQSRKLHPVPSRLSLQGNFRQLIAPCFRSALQDVVVFFGIMETGPFLLRRQVGRFSPPGTLLGLYGLLAYRPSLLRMLTAVMSTSTALLPPGDIEWPLVYKGQLQMLS